MNIAFIACTESGNLENQSSLLFRSIRKFCGRFRNSPIHSFQPRGGAPIKKATLEAFDSLGVLHHTMVLNRSFQEFPRTNKIFACAWAEENLQEDILVFSDSDALFVNEPKDLLLPSGLRASVRPVDRKGIGTSGADDPRDSYWKKLFSVCDVPPPPYLRTTVDQAKIRAYWNSGLIAVRRSAGLFGRWKQNFLSIMKARLYPPVKRKPKIGYPFLDQTALAVALAESFGKTRILSFRYNYPLPLRPIMPSSYRNAPLEELVHVHYHRWFNKPGFLSSLRPPLNRKSLVYQWIMNYLPFEPETNAPLKFQDGRRRGAKVGKAGGK